MQLTAIKMKMENMENEEHIEMKRGISECVPCHASGEDDKEVL